MPGIYEEYEGVLSEKDKRQRVSNNRYDQRCTAWRQSGQGYGNFKGTETFSLNVIHKKDSDFKTVCIVLNED